MPCAHPVVRVAVPGTCGELVQGTLDGEPCLISCPIGAYSIAAVRCTAGTEWHVPTYASKTRAALHAGLTYLGQPVRGGSVHLQTTLPRGRGYGSSTADIGATLYALGQAVGRHFTPAEVGQLAVDIEPSDSSLFPGLALWDHRHGRLYEALGLPPALSIVVLDPGGVVDTLAFNQRDYRALLQRLAPQHREAFALIRDGLQQGNLAAIGAAATLSATTHQALLFNPFLTAVLTFAQEVKALGVCRAHSGTLLGLLLDPTAVDIATITAHAVQRFAPALRVFSRSIVSGGGQILSTTE